MCFACSVRSTTTSRRWFDGDGSLSPSVASRGLGLPLVFLEDSTRLLIVVVGVWGVVGGTILLLDSLKLRELVSRQRSSIDGGEGDG